MRIQPFIELTVANESFRYGTDRVGIMSREITKFPSNF